MGQDILGPSEWGMGHIDMENLSDSCSELYNFGNIGSNAWIGC